MRKFFILVSHKKYYLPVGSSLGYGSGSGGPIGISVGIIEEPDTPEASDDLGLAVGWKKFLASHAVLKV